MLISFIFFPEIEGQIGLSQLFIRRLCTWYKCTAPNVHLPAGAEVPPHRNSSSVQLLKAPGLLRPWQKYQRTVDQDVYGHMPCAEFLIAARRTLSIVRCRHLVHRLGVLRTCRCFHLDAFYKKSEWWKPSIFAEFGCFSCLNGITKQPNRHCYHVL